MNNDRSSDEQKPGRLLSFKARMAPRASPTWSSRGAAHGDVIADDCDSLIEAYYYALRAAHTYAAQTYSLAQAILAISPVGEIVVHDPSGTKIVSNGRQYLTNVAEWSQADAAAAEHNIQDVEPFRRPPEKPPA